MYVKVSKYLDISKVPKLFGRAIVLCKIIMPDVSEPCIVAIVLSMFMHVISFKRIKVDEYNNGNNVKHVNVICFVFIKSGGGKDRLKDFIENHILKTPIQMINEYVKEYNEKRLVELEYKLKNTDKNDKYEKNKILNEITQLRQVELVVNKCTSEGFVSDAHAVSQMPLGAIFMFDGEVGLTLLAKDEKTKQSIECVIQSFDGKLPTKSIKIENTKQGRINNLIVNSLMFSDPEFLNDSKINENFKQTLEIGITRRSFITYQDTLVKTVITDYEEEYNKIQSAYVQAKKLNEEMTRLFNKIPDNAIYKLPKEVLLKNLAPYKKELTEKFNATKNSLERKEILSRELKALKMATFCACMNHSRELIINDEDFEQGIYLTEFLSQDFKNFLDVSSPYNDYYSDVYNFFIENLNKTFQKTELISYHKELGLSRRFFRREFNDIMDCVYEIAQLNGYEFEIAQNYNNNSLSLTMRKAMTPEYLEELNKALSVDTI